MVKYNDHRIGSTFEREGHSETNYLPTMRNHYGKSGDYLPDALTILNYSRLQHQTTSSTYGTELILSGTVRFHTTLPPQNSVFNTLLNVMEEYTHLQQALTVTNITGLQPQAINAGIFNPPHPPDNQLKHFK